MPKIGALARYAREQARRFGELRAGAPRAENIPSFDEFFDVFPYTRSPRLDALNRGWVGEELDEDQLNLLSRAVSRRSLPDETFSVYRGSRSLLDSLSRGDTVRAEDLLNMRRNAQVPLTSTLSADQGYRYAAPREGQSSDPGHLFQIELPPRFRGHGLDFGEQEVLLPPSTVFNVEDDPSYLQSTNTWFSRLRPR